MITTGRMEPTRAMMLFQSVVLAVSRVVDLVHLVGGDAQVAEERHHVGQGGVGVLARDDVDAVVTLDGDDVFGHADGLGTCAGLDPVGHGLHVHFLHLRTAAGSRLREGLQKDGCHGDQDEQPDKRVTKHPIAGAGWARLGRGTWIHNFLRAYRSQIVTVGTCSNVHYTRKVMEIEEARRPPDRCASRTMRAAEISGRPRA